MQKGLTGLAVHAKVEPEGINNGETSIHQRLREHGVLSVEIRVSEN